MQFDKITDQATFFIESIVLDLQQAQLRFTRLLIDCDGCIEMVEVSHIFPLTTTPQYISLDSKLLVTVLLLYVQILSWLVLAEIKCTTHVTLPERPINQFNQFSKADNRH